MQCGIVFGVSTQCHYMLSWTFSNRRNLGMNLWSYRLEFILIKAGIDFLNQLVIIGTRRVHCFHLHNDLCIAQKMSPHIHLFLGAMFLKLQCVIIAQKI